MNSKIPFVLFHYFVFYAGVVYFKNNVNNAYNIDGEKHLLRHRYYVVN